MKTNFINRLIGRVTSSNQPNNARFIYYGHLVDMQSGQPDFFTTTIHSDRSPYSPALASFSFEYKWKPFLCVELTDNRHIEQALINAFRSIYGKKLEIEIYINKSYS